jgi:hypothetical protein
MPRHPRAAANGPSVDALSTTISSCVPSRWRFIESTRRVKSSADCQVTTTIENLMAAEPRRNLVIPPMLWSSIRRANHTLAVFSELYDVNDYLCYWVDDCLKSKRRGGS